MKTVILLTVLLLCCSPTPGRTDGQPLPLSTKVSIEKLTLTENYQSAMLKCRERSSKSARQVCKEQKIRLYNKAVEDLERDPAAYFAARERNARTEKPEQ
jgi:hypothetical protein